MTRKQGRKLPFTKMFGAGNDFVVVDGIKSKPTNPGRLARRVLERRTGIGGDQLLVLHKSRKANFKMSAFNPDGNEIEMCGNGIRCLARYVLDAKHTAEKEITFETLAGVKTVTALGRNFRVNLGEPRLRGKEIPVNLSGRIINRPLRIEGKEFRITCLSMGNPHCVIFMENLDPFPVEKFGPLIETYHLFPRRTNVEFATPVSRDEIAMRVWERGTGETGGCGTGACAVAVAGVLNGLTNRKVQVSQRGGKVVVEWLKESNEVEMTGGAERLFSGEIDA